MKCSVFPCRMKNFEYLEEVNKFSLINLLKYFLELQRNFKMDDI